MVEKFQAIKDGLKRALGLQKSHQESMANKENMPAKPMAAPEKPVSVVELTEEQVEEASEYAENEYKENETREEKRAA